MVCLWAKFLKWNQDVSHLPESCNERAILSIFSESIFVLHTCHSGLAFPRSLTLNSSLLCFPLPPIFLWFTLYLTSRIICTYYRKFFLTESRAAPLFLVPCLASTFHPGGNHSSAPLRGFWAPASISCGFSQPSLTSSPTAVWQRLWLRLCTLFPHPQMGTEPHISQASCKKNPRDGGGV